MEITTKVISPTRGEKYKLSEALNKGLERRGVDRVAIKVTQLHKCFYGSKDIAVKCDSIMSMESLWGNSVDFAINGTIPAHQTKDGRFSIGWGCGCDLKHFGQFPQTAPPSNPHWEDYKNNTDLGTIQVWTSESQEVFEISEVIADEKVCDVLEKILCKIFAEEFLNGESGSPKIR